MNDEPLLPGCVSPNPPRPLEERLAQRPGLRARLHRLLDPLEASVADGSDAHAAEERVREELRQLGRKSSCAGPTKPQPAPRRKCAPDIPTPASPVKKSS